MGDRQCAVEVLVSSVWTNRRVLVTGHTGFKGSWLALWLQSLGADVTGFALAADSPSLFEQARVGELVRHVEGDVRDLHAVERVMADARPEIVFHLAAQPLVRLSYVQPVETYATNVMGTAHVLDAVRRVGGVCGRRSASRPTNAMRTVSGCGRTARATRWAGTTRTAIPRARPSW